MTIDTNINLIISVTLDVMDRIDGKSSSMEFPWNIFACLLLLAVILTIMPFCVCQKIRENANAKTRKREKKARNEIFEVYIFHES